MMYKALLILAGCLAGLTAAAADVETVSESPLRVDLQRVVATGVAKPVDGITSAGQPDEAAFEVFANSGYEAIIDLRTDGESRGLDEPAVVEGLGMDYVSLPVSRDSINFDNAAALDRLISEYDGPVLIHCGSGNRVGALLALRASLDGADDEAALAAGKEGGLTRLEPKIRDLLRQK